MSLQMLTSFIQRAKNDRALQGQLKSVKKKNPHATAEEVARIASAAGFTCSTTDVEAYLRSHGNPSANDAIINQMIAGDASPNKPQYKAQ